LCYVIFKHLNLDENGIYYSNVNLPAMLKTWPNVNPRFGPKQVQTDLEAHAVSATAFVVMTYTQKARVKEAEQSGKLIFFISMIMICFKI